MATNLVCSEKLEEGKESFRSLCPHYSRACSLVSPCCGEVYPCRLCHNEQDLTHEIDRYAVMEIVCRKCSKQQPVCESCVDCGIIFGRYFCSTCRLYDDAEKGQFHCSKCGLCRVGGKEQFFHCDTCGLCLPHSLQDTHTCRKEASKANCPVCMEDLHSSRDHSHVPKCGHLIHMNCYKQMEKNGLYQCPLCYSSIMEMSGQWVKMDRAKLEWVMPVHLRNFMVKIQCRDCRKEGETDFHVIGLKCRECGSYNTVRCGNEEFPAFDNDVNELPEELPELPDLLARVNVIFMGAEHTPEPSDSENNSDADSYSSTQAFGDVGEGGEGGDPVPALESDNELQQFQEGGSDREQDQDDESPPGLDSNSDHEMIVSLGGIDENSPRHNEASNLQHDDDGLPNPNEEDGGEVPVTMLPEPVDLSDSASYDGDQSDEGEDDCNDIREIDEDAPTINPYLPSSEQLNPGGQSSAAAGGDGAAEAGSWWDDEGVVVINNVQELVHWGQQVWSNADSPSHSSISDQSNASWETEEEKVIIGGDPESESICVGVVSGELGVVNSETPSHGDPVQNGEVERNENTCTNGVGVSDGCGQHLTSSEGEWETAKEELH